MTKQQISTRVITVVPTANITTKRGVTHAWTQATAGQSILGIADEDILAGYSGRVILGETAIAESGAAIDGTQPLLATDSVGRLIPATSGSIIAAILKPGQTTTDAGQFVEVYLHTYQTTAAP